MRGRLATTAGYRSPTLAVSHPLRKSLPTGFLLGGAHAGALL